MEEPPSDDGVCQDKEARPLPATALRLWGDEGASAALTTCEKMKVDKIATKSKGLNKNMFRIFALSLSHTRDFNLAMTILLY